jgi:hypothetical protein
MAEEESIPNPVDVIQETVAQLDPSSMVVGFATVVEWLEEDGSHTMSIIHTDMAPWHLYGLMTFGRDHHCVQGLLDGVLGDGDGDDEDF